MAMVNPNPSTKLLPLLGVFLAVVLMGAAALLLFDPGGGSGAEAGLGRLIATVQSARAHARVALSGDGDAIEALRGERLEIDLLRTDLLQQRSLSGAARELLGDAGGWQELEDGVGRIADSGELLAAFRAERESLLTLGPKLLAATGNVVSALSPAELETNQIQIERLELTVEEMQQSARALGAPGAAAASARRLGDSQQFLGEVIGGLSGNDTSLGITSVAGRAPADALESATSLFEQVRAAIAQIGAQANDVVALEAALTRLDDAADSLAQRFDRLDFAPVSDGNPLTSRLPLLLVGTAIVVLLLIVLAYYRGRDYRRAAEQQTEQNERNQQAILRLLDELSSLADGDLTVQATVTEDITGAIADSINYAIEALRELVTTVNESSILVDAAAKQTEATSRHLVRSAETQAKQAVAASDSVAKMAASIEEVSGNAERSADVARHAVDVAHKGGEAVRRTIEGMNTIRETIQDTSKRIKRLGESSQEIGNIVELIEEIAEQTNILALNASIEASRAGEASRGFAVVADEVQKLAERSTNATRKIEVLVSTIQSDTNEAIVSMERSTTDVVGGALLAENAGAALDEIEQVSHQIASLVQNISGSARDQSSVSNAINKNMQVLREISAKTTESTTATSSAISKLSELASQLRRTVRGFTLPDQGTATGILSQAQVEASLSDALPADVPKLDGVLAQAGQRRLQSG
jgi:twitching motility protein PilJ